MSPGDLLPTVDFGYQNTALADLSGTVWLDVDRRNGALDGGEDGIAGVTVNLLRGGQVVATAVHRHRRHVHFR